jgi:hypothetical protein
MTQPQRFPLAWPHHRPRTKAADRRRGEFVANHKAITLSAAADKLEDQIERLGGHSALLSSNVETRMDGRPRADRAPPADPGVCVYFVLKGKPLAMACDTFTKVEQTRCGDRRPTGWRRPRRACRRLRPCQRRPRGGNGWGCAQTPQRTP